QSPIPDVDLSSLQARCQHQISASECYQRYREMGISYGPAYQGIEHLSVGEGEVLARLRLPAGVARTEGGSRDGAGPRPLPYVLHPSLLDAALQACIGLLMAQQEPYLPFALSELSIAGEVPVEGWAWIRRKPESTTGLAVFDIDVCDDVGRIALLLHGLSIRQIPGKEEMQTVLLTPGWKEKAVGGQALPLHPSEEAPIFAQQVVLLCDIPSVEASRLQARMTSGVLCRSLSSSQSRRELRFQDVVLQLIQELQHLLAGVGKGLVPFLVQVVVAHREEPSLLEALAGVLKPAEQEYPQLQGQLIEIEEEPEEEELLTWLHENQRLMPQEPHVRYRNGKRWVREWQEVGGDKPSPYVSIPWKEGGCYLITGGAGGLARLC